MCLFSLLLRGTVLYTCHMLLNRLADHSSNGSPPESAEAAAGPPVELRELLKKGDSVNTDPDPGLKFGGIFVG